MLSVTYYAQNYAGIIGWSLAIAIYTPRVHVEQKSRTSTQEITRIFNFEV